MVLRDLERGTHNEFLVCFFSYLGATYLIGLIAGFMYSFDKKFFTGFIGGIVTLFAAAIIFSEEKIVSSSSSEPFNWGAFLGSVGFLIGFVSGEKGFEAAFKDKNSKNF